ncbi:hypothetical protein DWB77_04412 [Streptomyces hundungensis]|uniref:Lipoprotein n=1 Tax=Streptomyces hundungensis TaxID=1077946 RepID=A0A387HN38_9ACTN|nr:hypothetical protein [Streptomyces hundungensis]AYG82242.1 hypothetical protein DWB77_04412 [Streptomyces hundungensis]
MKTKPGALALLVSLTLSTLTGCSMSDSKDSHEIPSAGISTSSDAADSMVRVSSALYDLIGVKGKASETQPGVTECSGKDRDKYFTIFHPWNITPTKTTAAELDAVMERLKKELPKHGWEIVEYGRDTSKSKNLSLTADNDEQKVSVKLASYAKDTPPSLGLMVVSGCYQIPEGKKIERF